MPHKPLTIYKLIILYMLDKVNFPLTSAQISEFILEKEYTNFLTLQRAISELSESSMLTAHTPGNLFSGTTSVRPSGRKSASSSKKTK